MAAARCCQSGGRRASAPQRVSGGWSGHHGWGHGAPGGAHRQRPRPRKPVADGCKRCNMVRHHPRPAPAPLTWARCEMHNPQAPDLAGQRARRAVTSTRASNSAAPCACRLSQLQLVFAPKTRPRPCERCALRAAGLKAEGSPGPTTIQSIPPPSVTSPKAPGPLAILCMCIIKHERDAQLPGFERQ